MTTESTSQNFLLLLKKKKNESGMLGIKRGTLENERPLLRACTALRIRP
jgi:hypothetical protein